MKKKTGRTAPAAPLQTIQKLNTSLRRVRIALTAVAYFDKGTCGTKSVRRGVLEVVDAFIRLFGDDFQSFRIDGTDHQWVSKKKTVKQQRSILQRKLTRPGDHRDYAFHFARGDAITDPMELGVFCRPSGFVSSVCGFAVPADATGDQHRAFEQLFRQLCATLPVDQAYAGYAATDVTHYYFDGRAAHDAARIKELRRLLAAHPTLDCNHADVTQVPWLDRDDEMRRWAAAQSHGMMLKPGTQSTWVLKVDPATMKVRPRDQVWGLRWPSWLSFVGRRWVEKLGGVSRCRRDLMGKPLGDGVVVQLAETPPFGDTTALKRVARVTAPFRMSPDPKQQPDHILRPILKLDAMTAFIRRFDPPTRTATRRG